eukprot:TRINITY_DN102651_c0_g1_i1.p1 TRINITY_DN102651_c0_g1~~TRINITY_DN102651_c0_g1_i1.p1  ORF type:complete len:2623 (+),score=331.45 TRINITY_DN102651_c0_g1_i1:132-8000(+)
MHEFQSRHHETKLTGRMFLDIVNWIALPRILLLLTWFTPVDNFEIFAEQQRLILTDPSRAIDFNNTEYGTTHVDDYWAKIDEQYSPLEGWNLYKHVYIGCFTMQWGPAGSFAEKVDAEIDEIGCVDFCNRTQAYWQKPVCRCGIDEEKQRIVSEVKGACTVGSWQIYREYDYRSSMSPSTYDVARRLLYSIVTLRVSQLNPPVRYYIHAVNALESRPKFEYDYQLNYMIFNAVWDFGSSRMVGLSIKDWGQPMEFSIVTFNSTTQGLIRNQINYAIEDQLLGAQGERVREGLSSCDGLATVDILWGTYYTVVPATTMSGPQTVHMVIAIDIETKKVLARTNMQITLMNLQINALTHVLYGAGQDLLGRNKYYKLCQAKNTSITINGQTRLAIEVGCDSADSSFQDLGQLPDQVNQMYLQSASLDHHYNYAWFTFKESATDSPRIMEYHQDSRQAIIWNQQDALPNNAIFSSMINTAPRIIFSLYPPTLRYARFNSAGTKIFVSFNSPTLRGAIPLDTDGDEIPDSYDETQKATRAPCDQFVDAFTMKYMPGTMCEWTTDSDFYVEVLPTSTIAPNNLLRVRPGIIYAGRKSESGVYQFSQPSSDFAVIERPLEIPIPQVSIGGLRTVDVCTELTLDGTQSRGYGFRGPFSWALNSTSPEKPLPHIRQLQKEIQAIMLSAGAVTPQVIRLPAYTMESGTLYNFSLTVTSFWEPTLSVTAFHAVKVETFPVPPMTIFGASYREVFVQNPVGLSAELLPEGCAASLGDTGTSYDWTICKKSEAVQLGNMEVCNGNSPTINMSFVSGVASQSIYVEGNTLEAYEHYIFTARGNLTVANGSSPVILNNTVSTEVKMIMGDILISFRGGSGFTIRRDLAIVVDFSPSFDTSDQNDALADKQFTYACRTDAAGEPCFAAAPTPPSPTPTPSPIGGGGIGGGGIGVGRRLLDASLFIVPSTCQQVTDPVTKEPENFTLRGKDYHHGRGVTLSPFSDTDRYCTGLQGLTIVVQPNMFQPGRYWFYVNATKTVKGNVRVTSAQALVTVLSDTATVSTRCPQVNVWVESQQPVIVTEAVRLRGEVTNIEGSTVYTYKFQAYRFGFNPDYDPNLAQNDPAYSVPRYDYVPLSIVDFNTSDPAQVRTPPGTNYLVISPNVLKPGLQYKIRFTAISVAMENAGLSDNFGYAEVTFSSRGLPPSGGQLIASNISGEALVTELTFSMTGWGTEDLPLTYRFSYIQDYTSPFTTEVQLGMMFTERRYIKTKLPQGLVQPQNKLRVIGTVKTALGATTRAHVDVSIRPASSQSIAAMASQALQTDPETQIKLSTLVTSTPSSTQDEVKPLLLAVQNNVFAPVPPGQARKTPETPEMIIAVADLYVAAAGKGIRTDNEVNAIALLTARAISNGYVTADGSLGSSGNPDVATALFKAIDAFTPGDEPTYGAAAFRRLKGGRYMGGLVPPDPYDPRRLATLETRTYSEQYAHFSRLDSMQRDIAKTIFPALYPAEVPVSFAVAGQDIYIGKDNSDPAIAIPSTGPIRQKFALPSLARPGMPATFNFRYTDFKKFPFDYINPPANRTWRDAPLSPNESRPDLASKVPALNYSAATRLWFAFTLEVSDSSDDYNLVNRSLEGNVTFSELPRIEADTDFPSQCFHVNLGDGNFSNSFFDPRGSVFNDESCITMHSKDFVVFSEDLTNLLKVLEEIPVEEIGVFLDEFRSVASVDTMVVYVIAMFLVVYLARRADSYQAIQIKEGVEGIKYMDLLPSQVVEAPDPRTKILGTTILSFRRNHLIVGIFYPHKYFTRDRKAYTFFAGCFAVWAVGTLQHGLLTFRLSSAYIATGLVSAVIVFPLVQMLIFFYESAPHSRILKTTPPRSTPARPIPLKEQARPRAPIAPKRPGVANIRPPLPKAPPRAPTSLKLPVLSTQLAKFGGPGGPPLPKIPPRPPPNAPGRLPRPPKEPPPKNHLVARPDLPPGGISHLMLTNPQGGSAAPFGLALPELPELPRLPMGSLKGIADGKAAPAPPPKKSMGPRPPKAPPPMSKMFFAVPKGLQGVPAMPALPPSGKAPGSRPLGLSGPQLPKLPALRPGLSLSQVKMGGDSARLVAPPPPPPPVPPPKATIHGPGPPPVKPQAPATPREEEPVPDELLITGMLPGSIEPEATTPRAPEEDVEVPVRPRSLATDPEHTMMPPSSPMGPRPPSIPPSRTEAARTPELPELPGIPRAKSSESGALLPRAGPSMALALPGQSVPPNMAPPRVGPEDGALDLPALQLMPGGRLRQDLPVPPQRKPLELSSDILMRVPQVQRHPKGVPPPPPPPGKAPGALRMPGQSNDPKPIPPEKGEPIISMRKLQKIHGGNAVGARRLPKPPPKLPSRNLMPTPPPGPPPAHAIILTKAKAAIQSTGPKGPPPSRPPPGVGRPPMSSRPPGIAGGIDLQTIIAKARPVPPLVKPPSEPLPSFVHQSAQSAVQDIVRARQDGPKASALAPLPPKAPPVTGTLPAFGPLQPPVDQHYVPPEKPPRPAPIWAVRASNTAVTSMAGIIIFHSIWLIYIYGSHMPTHAVEATQLSNVVAFLMLFFIFESMKCVICACVELIKHETVKRQREQEARKTRMAMKAQRTTERRRQQLERLRIPPPLMG